MANRRKGFTLIELLIVVVIVGILALAAIPLITSNTRDARRSEGEQMLGSMKGQARVGFAKLGYKPSTLTGQYSANGCNVNSTELSGQYFTITDTINGTNTAGSLTATPDTSSDGTCLHAFNWGGGDGSFSWSS